MMEEAGYRLLTLLLLIAAFSIGGYFRRKADRHAGPLRTSEGMRLVVVLRLLGLMAISPLLVYLIHPQWVSWARFSLPDWVRMVAVVVAIGTVPVIYWIFSTLGNNISPTEATRRGHTLVTHGPYRWVRHPLYTLGVVFYLSLSLVTALWWLPLASLPGFLMLVRRTRAEEASLIAAFGDEYRAYMQRTGRFLPGLRALGQGRMRL